LPHFSTICEKRIVFVFRSFTVEVRPARYGTPGFASP
jgi:hypothetical protein